jgi:uncharacterized repeat protein (TIGR03809 family)
MTERADAIRGREIIERWCVLAEQRLEYLTELFETDRWRRFYSETALLENIQEAKSAVATWNRMRIQEATPDNQPIDLSWLGRRSTLAPRRPSMLSEEAPRRLSFDLRRQDAPPVVPLDVVPLPEPQIAAAVVEVEVVDTVDAWPASLDLAGIQQRYPHLHNAL